MTDTEQDTQCGDYSVALNLQWTNEMGLYQPLFRHIQDSVESFRLWTPGLRCTEPAGEYSHLIWPENPAVLFAHYMSASGSQDPSGDAAKAMEHLLPKMGFLSTDVRSALIERFVQHADADLAEEVAELAWRMITAGIPAEAITQNEAIQAMFDHCASDALKEVVINRARRLAEARAQQEATQQRAGGVMSLLQGVPGMSTERAQALTRNHLAGNPS